MSRTARPGFEEPLDLRWPHREMLCRSKDLGQGLGGCTKRRQFFEGDEVLA